MTLISATFKTDGSGWILGPALDRATHDPEWGSFNVEVPDGVWHAYTEAGDALEAAREQVMAATGLALRAPTRRQPCAAFTQNKPDPQKFMGDQLSRRCQSCGHYASAHVAAQAVA